MHQRLVPVLIQQTHQRDVAHHKHHHDDIFLARLKHHVFQLSIDHPHVAELGHDGGQRGFQAAVVLAVA
ncbi:hypothetical protein SDC9_183714 [bioreactor metagenome]|uniref:Uncharacterized protein n=1 Tax=bioreactor metagenome TaxID=1076179 RepID=A0A645HCF6_9ZZZZ